jgi:hypothetical protein
VRRYIAVGLAVSLVLVACSSNGGDEELEQRVEELEQELGETTSTTSTTTPSTTTMALTTAAELWCTKNPWPVIEAAEFAGAMTEDLVRDFDFEGVMAFWSRDGINFLTGEQKFDVLPRDWYEYDGAAEKLAELLEDWRAEPGNEVLYAETCLVAYETR